MQTKFLGKKRRKKWHWHYTVCTCPPLWSSRQPPRQSTWMITSSSSSSSSSSSPSSWCHDRQSGWSHDRRYDPRHDHCHDIPSSLNLIFPFLVMISLSSSVLSVPEPSLSKTCSRALYPPTWQIICFETLNASFRLFSRSSAPPNLAPTTSVSLAISMSSLRAVHKLDIYCTFHYSGFSYPSLEQSSLSSSLISSSVGFSPRALQWETFAN